MASRAEPRFLWCLGRRWAAFTLLICATSAAAQSPAPGGPAAPRREVVVTAPPPKAALRRQLQAFVKRVPAGNNGEALARWVSPICPVVAGMTQQQGEYVLLRLFQVAREAGAPVVEDGRCQANAYIIATADPQGLVKAIGRRTPAIFANGRPSEVRRFQQAPRLVRTWYNARLDSPTTGADSPFEGLEGLALNIPVIHHADPTRLRSNSPYALTSVIIVIDSAGVAGTNVGALADYLALTALVQLKPGADSTDAPSILRLFASDPPDGLTAWDKAFLHALYHSSLDDLHQASTIAIRMNEALNSPTPAP
jgi:hypothetical protein